MAAGFLPGASTMGDEDDRPCVQKTRIHLLTLITLLLTLGIALMLMHVFETVHNGLTEAIRCYGGAPMFFARNARLRSHASFAAAAL